MMMQQAFNDILLNINEANGALNESPVVVEANSFFDSSFQYDNTAASTLTSSILKNNFFSNLVSNDYLLSNATNKENYYLNDGSMFSSSNEANHKKDSPLSSGFSSLSSSLTSSSSGSTSTTAALFNCDSSLLSRSSSTCSLLTTNIQREQFKKESANKSSGDSSASSSPSSSSSSSPGPTAAESNLAFSFHNPSALSIQNFIDIFQLSQSNDLSSKSNLTKNTFSNVQEQSQTFFDDNLKQQQQQQQAFKSTQPAASKIDWNILNNSEVYLNQNREDFKWISKLNKEFWWNMNKLAEINQKLNETIKSNQSSFNNNKLNMMPKPHVPVAARKSYPLQPQQLPYMQNLNAMSNMNGFNYNYNGSQQQQQFGSQNSRVFGRVITNNRSFSQRIQ